MTSRPVKPTKPRPGALKALERMVNNWKAYVRWTTVAANCPPNSRMQQTAQREAERTYAAYFRDMWQVRRALGDDPDADGPEPKTHWDKGAMED